MKVVQTNQAPQAIGPYSQGVIVNNMFYSSGQIPLLANGEPVTGDVKVQTEQVFQNLQAVLEEAGASFETVIKTTVFLKDMDDFNNVNEVYGAYFSHINQLDLVYKLQNYRKMLPSKLKSSPL